MGTNAAHFDSWLILRGLKTLPLRMKMHAENAMAIAEFLSEHPKVEVFYPGLPTHPGYEIAKKQMDRFGGVVSFKLKSDVGSFIRGLDLFLLEHAATMSHASMKEFAREQACITDDVIRLSIGLEDSEDLIEDLSRGLESS
jgi:cystathionine beta-lyase